MVLPLPKFLAFPKGKRETCVISLGGGFFQGVNKVKQEQNYYVVFF